MLEMTCTWDLTWIIQLIQLLQSHRPVKSAHSLSVSSQLQMQVRYFLT